MSGDGLTRSQDESSDTPLATAFQSCLTLALDAEHPLRPPARARLGSASEVLIGRGEGPLGGAGEPRRARLELTLDDSFVSTAHARLERTMGAWIVHDAGSKNGTLVNGVPVARQALADGDVLELGRSFLVFRAAVPAAEVEPRAPLAGLATLEPGFAAQVARLAAVVRSPVPVLLHGEVGTGKEVAARAIHAASGRSGPFVAVNCGAIPDSLVEAELFGHKKGAFSGAGEDRAGLVRGADGGTLFLDELGELPPRAQVALLRVLQEREVHPVGAARPIAIDLRVVAATHRDLEAMVTAGGFRADLRSRLLGFRLELPPLHRRREDLGVLVAALIRRHAGAAADGVKLHVKVARSLFTRRFAANVRELEKLLETALALAGNGRILVEHLPAEAEPAEVPAPAVPGTPVEAPDDEALRGQLTALLTAHKGNIRAVGRVLGKAPVQVRRWLKRFGLDAGTFR